MFKLEKGPVCPKCGSNKVDEVKENFGPIWCNDCGYRTEHKENFDDFRDNGILRQMVLELWYD